MTRTDMHDDRARLLAMINGNWMTQAIGTAAALDLPRLLAPSPQGSIALAAATGCHEPSLNRLLRALTSLGVCTQEEDGRFALTLLGALLDPKAPNSLHAWASLRVAQWADWGELELSVRSGECCHKRRLGIDDFSQFDDDLSAAALFHRAMVDLTRRVAAQVVPVLEFTGDENVVDVGGGSGELLAALLAAHPAMHGTVFDLAHARAGALAQFAAARIADRCEFVTGSFFESVPAGRDVYLLKSVLHDWDDERAARILRCCRVAMTSCARLLVVERVAPDRWSECRAHQAIAGLDLTMLVMLSGRERSETEFGALLECASFQLERFTPTTGEHHVIEAVIH